MTPTKNQEEAMKLFVDALVGEEPSKLDHGSAANARRARRRHAVEFLYKFAALSMRIGAHRARAALGLDHDERALAIWKNPDGSETVHRPTPDGEEKVTLKGVTH